MLYLYKRLVGFARCTNESRAKGPRERAREEEGSRYRGT